MDRKQKLTKIFETQAISEIKKQRDESKVSIPSEENVKEARDWVNHNKK